MEVKFKIKMKSIKQNIIVQGWKGKVRVISQFVDCLIVSIALTPSIAENLFYNKSQIEVMELPRFIDETLALSFGRRLICINCSR